MKTRKRAAFRTRAGSGDGWLALLLLVGVAPTLAATEPNGTVAGSVLDPTGQVLPDVAVALYSLDDRSTRVAVTGPGGRFAFESLVPGSYELTASLPGYLNFVSDALEVAPDGRLSLSVTLELVPITETVVIQETVSRADENDPRSRVEIGREELGELPLPSDRFQEALPLVPGVVRDPDGRLSFNGSRPSQSTLLVNGANVTDPVTGDFAIEVPLKAIEAVEVKTLPYSAEYGRVTAAVAEVRTRGGDDEWDLDFNNMVPKPRFRDGKIKGFNSWVPQVRVSGPLKKGKVWISQGVAYRFARSRVHDVTFGADERILDSWDTFTQLDFKISENHSLTGTFSYFPVDLENATLDALTTEPATPDFSARAGTVR